MTVSIYPGDTNDLLPTLSNKSIDLIITSPPYNLNKAYEKKLSLDMYLDMQKPVIAHLYRILASTGSVIWQVGNYVDQGEVYPLDMYYYPLFKSVGFKLRNRIIWHFGHGLHASKRFSGRYETLLWFTKDDTYTFNLDSVRVPSKYPGKRHYKGANKGQLSGNPLGKNPSDVWEIIANDWESALWDIPNVKHNHPEKTDHPCQFPVELAERCVLALTNVNDLVFDPYMGVGSSLIAARAHGRNSLGAERDLEYVKTAVQRLKDYDAGKLKLRPIDRPIYQPKK